MTTETKLKPCPFCGGTADIHEFFNDMWCVVCECGCRFGDFGRKEELIEKWNKRAKPQKCLCSTCYYWDEINEWCRGLDS